MNILMDWKFWLVVLSLIKDVTLVVGIVLVKFNDLKHLEKDVKEIKTDLKTALSQMGSLDKRLAEREALCKERHEQR